MAFRTYPTDNRMVEVVNRAIQSPDWLNGRGKLASTHTVMYVSPAMSGGLGPIHNRSILKVSIFRVVVPPEDMPITEPAWLEDELEKLAGGWYADVRVPGDYNNRWIIVTSYQYGYV